jgi:hypothetical protein
MIPKLDRVDFRPNQCLAGADLTQANRRASELLWLHAARGHDVWGVATGYACDLDVVTQTVVVHAGMALDSCGRQLITAEARVVALPAVPADGSAYVVDLVARWAPTAALSDGCGQRGMTAERVDLRWELAGPATLDPNPPPPYSARVRLGTDVPLARLTTATAGAGARVDTGSRPVAHGLVRPKIATGRVLQSTQPLQPTDSYADWRIRVNTTAAGFAAATSPVYLVALDAHPFGDTATLVLGKSKSGATTAPPNLETRMQSWVGPFVSIESKDGTGFTLRVVTATTDEWATGTTPPTNPVAVSWAGIDTPDPAPVIGFSTYFLLANPSLAVIA